MPLSAPKLFSLWREVLTLSKLAPHEKVLVMTSSNSNPLLVDAATRAAADLAGTVARLELLPVWEPQEAGTDPTTVDGRSPVEGNDIAVAAMKSADLVIDLLFMLHSPAQKEVLDSGSRILIAYEGPETLARVMPSVEDRRRVLAARDTYARGRRIRITSDAGTDLTATIGDNPITAEYGYPDIPGRWDHWPSGFVARVPDTNSASGTVVLAPGDIILPFKTYVQTPIRLKVEDGYITRVEGGFEAEYLDHYMRSFEDRNAFAISHLGWGLQPKARWAALNLFDKAQTMGMEARAFYGNFLFSTGPGGGRRSMCHLDIPMRNCSFFIDDTPMTLKGDVIPEDQRVAGFHAQ